MSAAVNMDEVYVLDAWDDYNGQSTVEVYDTREKALSAKKKYFERHDGFAVFASVVKRRVR